MRAISAGFIWRLVLIYNLLIFISFYSFGRFCTAVLVGLKVSVTAFVTLLVP